MTLVEADGTQESLESQPFAHIMPTDDTQVAMGSLNMLELSADGGETWVQFPAKKFMTFNPYNGRPTIQAQLFRTTPIEIARHVVLMARMRIRGEIKPQVYEGTMLQGSEDTGSLVVTVGG